MDRYGYYSTLRTCAIHGCEVSAGKNWYSDGITRFWVSSMMEVVQKIDNQTLKWVNHVSEIGALYRSIPFYEENSTVKHVIKNMSKIMILNKRTNGKWIRKRNKAPLIKYLISNNWSEPEKNWYSIWMSFEFMKRFD